MNLKRLQAMHLFCGLCALTASMGCIATDVDEFRVKREDVFEFAQRPQIEVDGDYVKITFETQGYCDVTVAIENLEKKIIRHLASGVLGQKAPAPFQPNTKRQILVWDGKDDQGRYVDNKDACVVRVSLGLDPAFERSLLWRPKLRIGRGNPLLASTPEGIYVFEGRGVDHLRMFGHDGEYVKTVYPFPANRIDKVRGLKVESFPPDGEQLPFKNGFLQSTLLTSGDSAVTESYGKAMNGSAASGMAVHDGRIALAQYKLNRLSTDGSSGGLQLDGPSTGIDFKHKGTGGYAGAGERFQVGPTSMAFDPTGKFVYLTGYLWRLRNHWDGLHVVTKIDYEKNDPMSVFAGDAKQDSSGDGPDQFRYATSVACDANGRVYVSDYLNDRVQIFSQDAGLLKSLSVFRPAQVAIHHKTQEIFVFSWIVHCRGQLASNREITPTLTVFGSFDHAAKKLEVPLPLPKSGKMYSEFWTMPGLTYAAALDSWTEPPSIWIAKQGQRMSSSALPEYRDTAWEELGIQIYSLNKEKLRIVRDFGEDLLKKSVRANPPDFSLQRLVVNPKTGKLYVCEFLGYQKCFHEVIEIDPGSGTERIVQLPFDAEDMCFDHDGLVYLRTDTIVARFDFETMREVPWDYGEERVRHGAGGGGRYSNLIGGLANPGVRPGFWHQGGMSVSLKGHLALSCGSREANSNRKSEDNWLTNTRTQDHKPEGKPYTPTLYPGRVRWQEIHVFDRRGKLLIEDAIPGLHIVDGIGIDRDDCLYVMAAATRVLDGKPHFNPFTGTVMKFKPKSGRIVGSSINEKSVSIPLSRENWPKRDPQLKSRHLGVAWIDGAEWFFGGVGYGGFNVSKASGGCACWNARFCLDYFRRSFAPEVDRYSVAVLDANGNLMVRFGKYGNADSNGPKSLVPIGGDEVALFHAPYLATDTDRRVFIADPGNGRIVSVLLNFRHEVRIPMPAVVEK